MSLDQLTPIASAVNGRRINNMHPDITGAFENKPSHALHRAASGRVRGLYFFSAFNRRERMKYLQINAVL